MKDSFKAKRLSADEMVKVAGGEFRYGFNGNGGNTEPDWCSCVNKKPGPILMDQATGLMLSHCENCHKPIKPSITK